MNIRSRHSELPWLPSAMLSLLIVPGLVLADERSGSMAKPTATPIKHAVIIIQENRSFDHYFATYPVALNPPEQPVFVAKPGTPSINGLTETLLRHNPNLVLPYRLDRKQALTCDHSHDYAAELKAYNFGLLDRFEQEINVNKSLDGQYCPQDDNGKYTIVMGFFDGNTVTALWNYAQSFALSDNFFGTTFGPSTVGAINLVAADNSGVLCGPPKTTIGDVPLCGVKGSAPASSTSIEPPRGKTVATNYGDPDPFWDICSKPDASALMALGGKNIGDYLTTAGVRWGFFQAGFEPSASGKCDRKHVRESYDRYMGIDPSTDTDARRVYIPHHNPFQYYASTANPGHLPPTSISMIGKTDQANHLYDIKWVWQLPPGHLPAVTFLRAPAHQDGHPGYSDPLDEQQFLVETLNRLQQRPEWESMVIFIVYDDGGGWYDHVMPPIVNQSDTSIDNGCGQQNDGAPARCGYGPRLPLLLISPWIRPNYVSHRVTDQTSIVQFIEHNWLQDQRISKTSFDNLAGSLLHMFDFDQLPTTPLLLDPQTGLPLGSPH